MRRSFLLFLCIFFLHSAMADECKDSSLKNLKKFLAHSKSEVLGGCGSLFSTIKTLMDDPKLLDSTCVEIANFCKGSNPNEPIIAEPKSQQHCEKIISFTKADCDTYVIKLKESSLCDDLDTDVDSDIKNLINNINALSLVMLKSVVKTTPKENLVLSPLGGVMAMGLPYSGATGKTLSEMNNVLRIDRFGHRDMNVKAMARYFRIIKHYHLTTLSFSNGLWTNVNTFNDNYLVNLKKCFGVQIKTPININEINSWTEKNTLGLIKNILTNNDTTAESSAVLLNAMGFKDLWKDQFKKTKTHDDNFTKLDGTISKKSMMYLNANTSVYKNRIMVVVRLPYSNQLSMVIAAPVYKGKGKPLSPISIDMISAIDKVYNNKQKKNVEVEIPKFSVQTSLDMHDSFSKLGMKHVFGDTGEFTDATDSPFQLDRAISQTAIMISEEGAVINTGKEVKTDREMSLSKKEQKNKRTNNKKSNKRNNNHKFNTPFVFAIVDDSTRSIIFLGQIVDPQI